MSNPCAGLWHSHPPTKRDRTLSDEEIKLFWRATDEVEQPFRGALKLLLLTGCRVREVTGMRRDELSGDSTMWTLPGTRTKNHRPLTLPLPPLAKEVLSQVRRIENENGFVYTTTTKTPISGWSKVKKSLDDSIGPSVPPWRLHDLRRTAATGMHALGILPHVVEAVLNHVSGHKAGVAGVYNLHQYDAEKKMALARWAEHISGLTTGTKTKVVTLPKKPRAS